MITLQDGGFTWLAFGGVTLLLRPGRTAEKAQSYGASSFAPVLYTNDLEGTAKLLTEQGVLFGEPDGTDRCMTFRDPDGNWFKLVDPANHG